MDKTFVVTVILLQFLISVICVPLPDDQAAEAKVEKHLSLDKIPEQFRDLAGSQNDNDDDDDGDDNLEICLICHEDLVGQPTVELKCGHKYHVECCKYYRYASGQLESCFLCGGELRTKDNNKELLEILDAEDRSEVVRMKLKIGLMAGFKSKPQVWDSAEDSWHSPDLFHAREEEDISSKRYFE